MKSNLLYLRMASEYAQLKTGCTKVGVGSIIIDKFDRVKGMGANQAIPDVCAEDKRGCLRVELYGDNSKNHREPGDCRAIHSEVDAIIDSACNLKGCMIYITRYPCENCARAIVRAGISKVVYGRDQIITDETKRIFDWGKVEVVHESSYTEFDVYE